MLLNCSWWTCSRIPIGKLASHPHLAFLGCSLLLVFSFCVWFRCSVCFLGCVHLLNTTYYQCLLFLKQTTTTHIIVRRRATSPRHLRKFASPASAPCTRRWRKPCQYSGITDVCLTVTIYDVDIIWPKPYEYSVKVDLVNVETSLL